MSIQALLLCKMTTCFNCVHCCISNAPKMVYSNVKRCLKTNYTDFMVSDV